MKVKTNTNLFRSSTMYVTYTRDKSIVNHLSVIYHIVKPLSSHRKSFAYDARTTKGLTYKIYKNLLLALMEDRHSARVTYDIV